MTFPKMRDDASQKLPSMIRMCRRLCYLIDACWFSTLLCLGTVLREVSNSHPQTALYHLLLLPFHLLYSPSSSPPSRPSH